MKRTFTIAIAVTAIFGLGLGACGNDNKKSLPDLSDESVDPNGDGSINLDDLTPGNVTDECKAIYAQLITAMSTAFSPAANQANIDEVFGDVADQVPDELQGDVALLADALRQFGEVMKQYNGDMTSPEAQEAMQLISTPEYATASDNLNAYFDATCPDV